jgi:glucosamine kinase
MLLGVDAGGTSSRARLIDASGRLIGESRAGPGNAYTSPVECWSNIQAAISEAYVVAGRGAGDRAITRVCLGVAGLDPERLQLPAGWSFEEFAGSRIETDAFIALQGAHCGSDGAVLIVGTGVVGLAVRNGRRVSIGGYGPLLSDEGGGAWLGREAVRRTLWSADGRIDPTPLTEAMTALLGEPDAVLEWARTASAADYGEFAPLVLRTAQHGDAAATAIVAEAAVFVNRIILSLARSGASRLSVLGGLADGLTPYLAFEGIELRRPLGDALSGALLLADALPLGEHAS